MRYFIRENGETTQIDESTNTSYLNEAQKNFTEISKEEYDALCPKETEVEHE